MTTTAEIIGFNIESGCWYKGKYYSPNIPDLISTLKGERTSGILEVVPDHNGYDESYDGSMCLFHYKDSVLVVGPSNYKAYK